MRALASASSLALASASFFASASAFALASASAFALASATFLASASALAFALLFVPAYIVVKLIARRLGNTARRSVIGPVDRVLGGGFGMLKGLIGATLFFLLANLATDLVYGSDAKRPDWMRDARTYPLLNASGRAVVDWVETRRKGSAERIEEEAE